MNLKQSVQKLLTAIGETIKRHKTGILSISILLCIVFFVVKGGKKVISFFTDMKPLYQTSDLMTEGGDPQTAESEVGGTEVSDPKDDSPSVTYRISPEGCTLLFGKTPEEFVPIADNCYPWTDDFSRKAEVDEEGYLLLTMSEKQKAAWRESALDYYESIKNFGRVIVSEDFTRITVVGYKETLVDDVFHSGVMNMDCRVIQFLNTQNTDSIKIDYTIIDGGTNEIKFHCIWPEEKMNYKFNPSDYSSIKTTNGQIYD